MRKSDGVASSVVMAEGADTVMLDVVPLDGPTSAGVSPKRMAWNRFRRDRWAMVGLAIAAVYLLVALLAPLICKVLGISPTELDRDALNEFGLPKGKFGGISGKHWLGVEPSTGRDILARLMYGARVSLFVGFVCAVLSTAIGMALGMFAGYFRGKFDTVMSRFGDLILTFPSLILVVALTRPATQRLEALGLPEGNPARLTYIILVTTVFGWVGVFRLVRGQTLAIREREFIEAARSSGAPGRHIVFRELMPNLWAPVIAITSTALPGFVGLEAALSFLGVGILPPSASWGVMLDDSVHYYRADPMYFFIPGFSLLVLVMAFYLLGEGLRSALDPKSQPS